MPYHAAIWIVDRDGRRILDVAPDIDDVRGGRLRDDPLDLVARASRILQWLQSLNTRLGMWAEPSTGRNGVTLQPIVIVGAQGRAVEAGVRFCSAPDEEFDRMTATVGLLADENELDRLLEPLRRRVTRRFDEASAVFARLREAVESWRVTEELAASGPDPLVIGDVALEE